MVLFGQSCCFRAKEVGFGQSGCVRAKVVVLVQGGCFRAKVVLLGQELLYSGKNGCFRTKW